MHAACASQTQAQQTFTRDLFPLEAAPPSLFVSLSVELSAPHTHTSNQKLGERRVQENTKTAKVRRISVLVVGLQRATTQQQKKGMLTEALSDPPTGSLNSAQMCGSGTRGGGRPSVAFS